MYSILKTEKRLVTHGKNLTATASCFLTNNHIVLCFSDCSVAVYSLHLGSPSPECCIWEGHSQTVVTECRRLVPGRCVLLCKHSTNVYVLDLAEDSAEHTQRVELLALGRSAFSTLTAVQQDTGLLSQMGCQFRLHTFANNCFIVEINIHKDRKILLDCYSYVCKKLANPASSPNNFYNKATKTQCMWQLHSLEIELEVTGHYIVEPINARTGQMAVYKQEQAPEADWVLTVYSPFAHCPQAGSAPQQPGQQTRVYLPPDKFTEDMAILQICEYVDDSYMIIASSRGDGQLLAYQLVGLTPNSCGNAPQATFSFQQIPQHQSSFLSQNFIKMVHVNPKDNIFFSLAHVHERMDGELYENALVKGNLRTGVPVERGFCCLKSTDFSPNQQYILDLAHGQDNYGETYYHIRLLFAKSSLYMFLIDNSALLGQLSSAFKYQMVNLL